MEQVVKQRHPIPDDVREIYNFLHGMKSEFSDTFDCEVTDAMQEILAAHRKWKAGGSEPNWQSFRAAINDACRNDGMPILFDEQPDEAKLDGSGDCKVIIR